MYVRVKSTPNSPRKSVQIVKSVRNEEKVSQKIVRYVGIAMDDYELEQLKQLGETIKIKLEAEDQGLLFSPEDIAKKTIESKKENQEITDEDYQVNIKNIKEEARVVIGIHDIYGKLFEELGYDKILKDPARNKASVRYFKDIVMARIANPTSKRDSVMVLDEDFGISLNLDQVYRMMDKLDNEAIERLNQKSYENTKQLYKEKIDVVFFDCTTLYFEAFDEDELRKKGYSKDLKFNEVQVVLALMVTKEGLPIGYEVYNGATYEGHTLIPAVNKLRQTYDIGQVVFVADAGMMTSKNMEEMELNNIEYIVGCRLKSLPHSIQNKITDPTNFSDIKPGYKFGRFNHNGRQIIVSYSEKRAKKDAYERHKVLEKLKDKLNKQKNPKEYLSNFGYKKYLKINGETTVILDEDKIKAQEKWDGLLGVISTATGLSDQDILAKYTGLWEVENAFRVTKHDLKVRPVFHWKPRRVRAHLAISFAAFSLVKYLEYRVKLQYKKMSPELIKQALMHVQTSILVDTSKNIRYGLPSKISKDAKKIYSLMSVKKTDTPYIIEKL